MNRSIVCYEELTIGYLIEFYKIPDFQRVIIEEHSDLIYNGIKEQYLKTSDIFLVGSISIGVKTQGDGKQQDLIVFDGQHRLSAIQRLFKEYPIGNIKIRVDIYRVVDEEQIHMLYNMINQNRQVKIYRSIDTAVNSRNVEKWFRINFSEHWKDSDKPILLNINGKTLLKRLEVSGMLNMPANDLIIEMTKLNDYYKTFDDKKWNDCGISLDNKKKEILVRTNFYLGLYKRYEWIDKLFKDYINLDHSIIELIHKKDKIPKKRRDEVWNKRFNNLQSGKCFTCNDDINYQKGFHCGHIKSRHNGGSVNVDNLEIVCSTCNLNMSTMNMMDYKQLF